MTELDIQCESVAEAGFVKIVIPAKNEKTGIWTGVSVVKRSEIKNDNSEVSGRGMR